MKFDRKTGMPWIDFSKIDNAVQFIKHLDFHSTTNSAVYFAPHASKQDIEKYKKNNPNIKTVWDTPAGKEVCNRGWLSEESPFTFAEKKMILRELLQQFFIAASGNFQIVGLDPKMASGASPQFQWFYEASFQAKNVMSVSGVHKMRYFNAIDNLRDTDNLRPGRISAKTQQVIRPSEKSWELGVYIRPKRKSKKKSPRP
ncbi:MAG: hypothetical protein CMP22_04845 [Rickettsiales bacterium]|nr:hypothetical protein [Rickettsiales bacterium]